MYESASCIYHYNVLDIKIDKLRLAKSIVEFNAIYIDIKNEISLIGDIELKSKIELSDNIKFEFNSIGFRRNLILSNRFFDSKIGLIFPNNT